VVCEIGCPDPFTLLFIHDLGERNRCSDVLFESWRDGAQGREAVFVNGEKIRDELVETACRQIAAPAAPSST